METCRMCGARLNDRDELKHHNEQMHPNIGKKGGEGGKGGAVEMGPPREERPERPID